MNLNHYLVQFTSRMALDEHGNWQTWAYETWAKDEVMAADLAYDRAMGAGMDPLLEPSYSVTLRRKGQAGDPMVPRTQIARLQPYRPTLRQRIEAGVRSLVKQKEIAR